MSSFLHESSDVEMLTYPLVCCAFAPSLRTKIISSFTIFDVRNCSDEFFFARIFGCRNAHIPFSMLRFRPLASHKNNLIIYDFWT